MTKLQVVVSVLAVALVVAVVETALPGSGPHWRAGLARHEPRHRPAAAGLDRASRSAAGADSIQAAGDWSKARVVLTARLEAAQRATAERRARAAAARRRRRLAHTRLCRRYQHVALSGPGGASLVIRNDNYGAQSECLENRNRWANFVVTSFAVRHEGREPVAFPNIFYGCSWGVCSPNTELPRRLSRLRNPVTSWYTAGHPSGRWDVAYDIWFAKQRRVNGQNHGAEVMLWLRTRGLGAASGAHSLVIDRHRWELEHWTTMNPATGGRWPLIIFRMVRPRGFVKRLALMPFFRRLEAMGLLRRSWWLTAIEAGFEVWRGGAGLRTTSFWVRP